MEHKLFSFTELNRGDFFCIAHGFKAIKITPNVYFNLDTNKLECPLDRIEKKYIKCDYEVW